MLYSKSSLNLTVQHLFHDGRFLAAPQGKTSICQASIICCCFVSEIGADGIREGVYGKQMGSCLVSVLVVRTGSADLRRCVLTGASNWAECVTVFYKQTDRLTNEPPGAVPSCSHTFVQFPTFCGGSAFMTVLTTARHVAIL